MGRAFWRRAIGIISKGPFSVLTTMFLVVMGTDEVQVTIVTLVLVALVMPIYLVPGSGGVD